MGTAGSYHQGPGSHIGNAEVTGLGQLNQDRADDIEPRATLQNTSLQVDRHSQHRPQGRLASCRGAGAVTSAPCYKTCGRKIL